MEVVSHEEIDNGIKLEVQITPPARTGKARYFTDELKIKIKDGGELTIRCTGLYKTKPNKAATKKTPAKTQTPKTSRQKTLGP